MKQPKPKQPIIVAGLFVVSFLMFFIASLIRIPPVLVFSLTFQPLNITTTAMVDEDGFLFLSETNQVIELPTLPQGIYQIDLTTSGGMVVDSLTDTGLATLTLMTNHFPFEIEINDLIGFQQFTWYQSTTSSVTLTMTNFVKINDSLLYGVYIQDIRIYKI
jgi:hypothetical protein